MARKSSLFRLDSEGPILEYKELPSYDRGSVQIWADFCADCFREKRGASSNEKYFLDNYYNDPFQEFQKIFIAAERKSNIWGGAVRVIRRKIWQGVGYISVVGLADVCTNRRGRGEGIGTRLVKFALDACRELGETTFMLHADEKYHSFYARNGFHMLRSQWSLVSTCMREADIDDFCRSYQSKIALVDIDREHIVSFASKFSSMSENASADLCLPGTVEKSVDYFIKWVARSQKIGTPEGGKFRCICDKKYIYDGDVIGTERYLQGCIAYVCFAPSQDHPGQFKVYDIGVLASHANLFAEYFSFLMVDFSRERDAKEEVSHMKFELPSALGVYFASSGFLVSHVAEADNGWMICTDNIDIRDAFDCEYTFWPIDFY